MGEGVYSKEACAWGPLLKGALIARVCAWGGLLKGVLMVCAWGVQFHSKADLLVEFDGFLEGFYLVLVLPGNVLLHQSLLELFGHPQHLDITHLFRQIFYLHVKLLKFPGRERGEEEGSITVQCSSTTL